MPDPDGPPSALEHRIARYLTLDAAERSCLAALQGASERVAARRRLRRAGEPADSLFVVHAGWLCSVRYPCAGRRHVEGLHLGGDVIGLGAIALPSATSDLITVTDGVLSRVPRAALPELLAPAPRLAGLLCAFAAIETTVLSDRLAAVSRLNAEARIAHFLLEIDARLALAEARATAWFAMPLSQEAIGDAVGLTQAYVNRSLKELEDRGLILRRDNGVEIRDAASLAALCGFADRWSTADLGWLVPRY
ncbi:MAG: Crp/Fnr family transcriptional regulator [Acuticoccus sp.]